MHFNVQRNCANTGKMLGSSLTDCKVCADMMAGISHLVASVKFNIEIHGIPEYEGENLQDIVIKTGQRMSVDVITEDIDIVHRLYRKSPAIKPIIVRFTTYKKRREFYKSRFNLKEANTTEIIGSTQGDTEGRIFINENLTQYRQEILAKARKMKRANKIYRVWTVDGKIFVRKTEESRPRRISEVWDLEELAT